MNLIHTLNGHKYGYFLPIGLSSCPFCSTFILYNGLKTTACLSDMNVDVYKFNEIHDLLIGPFSYASSHLFIFQRNQVVTMVIILIMLIGANLGLCTLVSGGHHHSNPMHCDSFLPENSIICKSIFETP